MTDAHVIHRGPGSAFPQNTLRPLRKSNPDKILIHGTINSQVLPIAHAWVENENGDVYDLVKNEIYNGQEYYEKWQAVKVKSYTQKETAINATQHGSWGPWDEEYRNIPGLVHH